MWGVTKPPFFPHVAGWMFSRQLILRTIDIGHESLRQSPGGGKAQHRGNPADAKASVKAQRNHLASAKASAESQRSVHAGSQANIAAKQGNTVGGKANVQAFRSGLVGAQANTDS